MSDFNKVTSENTLSSQTSYQKQKHSENGRNGLYSTVLHKSINETNDKSLNYFLIKALNNPGIH